MMTLDAKVPTKEYLKPLLVLACIQALLLYVVGHQARTGGLPLDDAWIHQVIARNFAESGELGFVPGKFGSAASSLLWPLLLSIPFFFGNETASIFALVINSACYLCIGAFIFIQLRKFNDPLLALIFSVAFVISGNFVWFAFSGMEAMLQICLVCMIILAWETGREKGSYWLAGALSGALVFTRVEAAFFPFAIICYERLLNPNHSKQRLIRFVLVATGGILALLLLNQLQTGNPLPPTMEGRRWLWLLTLKGIPYHQIISLFPYRWLDKLSEFTLGIGSPSLAWAACGIALYGAIQLWRQGQHGIRLLLLFQAGQLMIYALLLPVEGHAGRYQPMMPALYMLTLCYGTYSVCAELGKTTQTEVARLKLLACTLLSGLLIHVFMTTLTWGDLHAKAVAHIDQTEVAMGHQLATLPETEKVASFDLGGIAFFSRRPILDLGGLSDPGLLPYLKSGKIHIKLQEAKITTLVIPQGYDSASPDPWNFLITLGLDKPLTTGNLLSIGMRESPPEIWIPAFRAMLHSAPRQEVYRLCAPTPCKK